MRDLNFEVAHVCPSFVVIHIYNIFTIYLNIVTLQMIKTLGKKASKSGGKKLLLFIIFSIICVIF